MKHLLLSASLLLFASNLYAQLHVSPSATADSYIYANDVVIYVEDDIHLVLNNVEETQASIYLRGDSQLIQGDKSTSTNYGNGSLSVWQRGAVNAFDYHAWASPVGNPNDPTVGNTNFGIPRIFDVREDTTTPLTLSKTYSTQSPSTPALNGIPSDATQPGMDGTLNISRRWIYTLRAQSGYANWIYIGNQNGLGGTGLAAGEGFTMKGTGISSNTNDQLYDFRGRPNDGDITIGVAHNGTDFQETLTGNPYPSALDMADFLLDGANSAINASAYYWESNPNINSHYLTEQQAGYGVWQPLGGVDIGDGTLSGEYVPAVYYMYDGAGNQLPGPSVGNGGVYQRRFAPVGQGFMVRGVATGTITYKNTMRRHVARGTDNFSDFRNATGTSATSGPVTLPAAPQYLYPTIRFHVEVDEAYVRDMVMILSEETTKGNDRGWDSKHPALITGGDAFWVLENETDPYVIQARPFDYMELIPLGLRVKNGTNTFKITAVEMHGFGNLSESHGAEIRLYLYDQLNNQYQRISPEHTAMINHNGNAGKIEDRYFIVYRRGILEPSPTLKNQMANVNFFQNNPQSKLEVSNPDVLNIRNASIYDMRGRLVLTENNIGKVAKFSFPTDNLSTGVYIVKLSTTDNGIIDYKITVHNR